METSVSGSPPVACPLPWAAPKTAAISVAEAKPLLAQFWLLDVREEDEHEECNIPGSTLIPLGTLPGSLHALPKDKPILVYCAVGGRSAQATHFLRGKGYDATNLAGGMRAWLMS